MHLAVRSHLPGRPRHLCFQHKSGTWGVLHLEGPEEPKIYPMTGDIEVLQGNRLYVFSMTSGSFLPGVEVNLKPFWEKAVPKSESGYLGTRVEGAFGTDAQSWGFTSSRPSPGG